MNDGSCAPENLRTFSVVDCRVSNETRTETKFGVLGRHGNYCSFKKGDYFLVKPYVCTGRVYRARSIKR